ncbi:MAG TPA: GNAT family N-acetyltransferase [Actinospica sp.]|jgi:GNAT superfamily N-acetyltransferase|nr:GNAT family N-acetyltransferase [Actinospica sp.]
MTTLMRFDPAAASDSELRECHDVLLVTGLADFPGAPAISEQAYLSQVRLQADTHPMWVARDSERIVGTARVTLPRSENLDLATIAVRVLPSAARQGVGTSLLALTLPTLRSEGRRIVRGSGLRVGNPGDRWTARLGFRKVLEHTRLEIRVKEIDPARWAVDVPAGFRLAGWTNQAPEEMLAGYARARTAMSDAPTGTSALSVPDWTPERVRTYEAELAETGFDVRTVVAVHEASGAVVGLTEVVDRPVQPGHAFQRDTTVLPEYRGHGLGRCMKSAMLRRLVRELPDVTRIGTACAAENHHMIRINHEVGYQTLNTIADVEIDVDELCERLAEQAPDQP